MKKVIKVKSTDVAFCKCCNETKRNSFFPPQLLKGLKKPRHTFCRKCQSVYPSGRKLKRYDIKFDPSNSGIYAIQCNITKRVYVGSSKDVYARLKNHDMCLRNLSHNTILINEDCKTHGFESFTYKIITYCPPSKLLDEETFTCKEYVTMGWDLYNKFSDVRVHNIPCPAVIAPIVNEVIQLIDTEAINIADLRYFINQQVNKNPRQAQRAYPKLKKHSRWQGNA